MSKVVVSIVSFNSKEYLLNCLKDLKNQSFKSDLEVWVIDNNSTDGTIAMIEKDFPKVKLIKSEKNLGFAKGQNEVLSKAVAEYYLMVNPDTEVPEDAVESMVKFMDENKNCGIAGSKLSSFDGSFQSNGGDLPFGLALLSWLFNLESIGIKTNFHRTDKDFYLSGESKGWIGGTFMMIKKDVLEKVGFLNEKYFMYVEDVEFCYRARKKGFSVMINPDITVKHRSGGSSVKNPKLFQWQNEMKNLILFYKTNMGSFWALILKILIYISLILRIAVFALLGKGGISATYAKIAVTL